MKAEPIPRNNRQRSQSDSDARPITIASRKSFSVLQRTLPVKQNTFAEATSRARKFRMFLKRFVLPGYASLSRPIITLNDEPTTPNVRLNLNPQGVDRIDPSRWRGRKKTGEHRDSEEHQQGETVGNWVTRTDLGKQVAHQTR